MLFAQGILGLASLTALAWVLSENRRAVEPITILAGLGSQLVLGVLLLHAPFFREAFLYLNDGIGIEKQWTYDGASQ